MTDLTLTDVLRRMDRRIKDQRKPSIEDVQGWADALYRIRARDDQAVRGFIDRDIQQREEIERLREERDTLARMVNRVAELEAALKEDK
jgi:hypothetical protein